MNAESGRSWFLPVQGASLLKALNLLHFYAPMLSKQKSLICLLKGDLVTEQFAGAIGGLSSGARAGEGDGLGKRPLFAVKERDEELVIPLGNAQKQAINGPGAKMNMGRLGARMHRLAKSLSSAGNPL